MRGASEAALPEAPGPPRAVRRRLGRTFSGPRWDEYRALLRAAIDHGYDVVSLEEWLLAGAPEASRTLLLRHDVDQHPRSVAPMLRAERELGLRSTWYFRWRTADRRVIASVRAAGGAVGLHYETLTRRALAAPGHFEATQETIESCRAELREEVRAFERLFGPIRSICPHGDSRVPGLTNQVLLRGQDPADFGVELDGNESLRRHRLGVWLTDRSAPGGGWSVDGGPRQLLAEGRTPILCLTHPNNFAGGAGLWADRLLSAALPDPSPAGAAVLSRTRSDRPVRLAGTSFAPVAETLEAEVRAYYAHRGEPLDGAAGANTLLTNSHFAERRTDTLLAFLFANSTLESLDGLRVLDGGCGFGAVAAVLASRGADVLAADPNGDRFAVGRAVAERHGLPVRFQQARLETTVFGSDAFDVAVLNNSFCYLVDHAARRAALQRLRSALRPGGWIVMRNPNRLFPVDQFTRLPLLGMLPPRAAAVTARLLGRRRSDVRLLSARQARRELRAAGFEAVAVGGTRTGGMHRLLAPFARYQHVVARRPAA